MKGFNTTDYEFAVQPVDNGNLGGKFVVASSKDTGIKQAQAVNAKVYAANGKSSSKAMFVQTIQSLQPMANRWQTVHAIRKPTKR